MKNLVSVLSALPVASALAATVPTVSNVAMTQADDRVVAITYELADGPAIVTLDIRTNGVSIGAAKVSHVRGDVNRLVSGTSGRIEWLTAKDWPGQSIAAAQAVVTARPTWDPPDYMVVELAESATNRIHYYASADALPGGLFGNRRYRTDLLVMRRIRATGVAWAMGAAKSEFECSSTREATHQVVLTNDYYLAVFETTQAQWGAVTGAAADAFFRTDYAMRPMECVLHCDVRGGAKGDPTYMYPNDPDPASFLGRLRLLADNAVRFDLPSEAQWEFACRAGTATLFWNNGKMIAYDAAKKHRPDDPGFPGRGWTRGGQPVAGDENYGNTKTNEWTVQNGTAIVGSYEPNAWGLYDMHGNVSEWCQDYMQEDNTSFSHGEVTANGLYFIRDGKKITDDTTEATTGRTSRGGSWGGTNLSPVQEIKDSRASSRSLYDSTFVTRRNSMGFRIACPCPAE